MDVLIELLGDVEDDIDMAAGLLVSRNRLLISRDTNLPPERLTALLSHEIGVHLLTYFNGDAQGLAGHAMGNLLILSLNTPAALHGVSPRSRTDKPRYHLHLVGELTAPLFAIPH